MDSPPTNPSNLSDEEKARLVRQAAGQCNFCCLFMFSATAFILGVIGAVDCGLVNRNLQLTEPVETICANLTDSQMQQCEVFFSPNGAGLWQWQATLPTGDKVCFDYTTYITDRGYVTPNIDTNLNSARAFSIVANIFGMFAFVTLAMASCCPISRERLSGLSCTFFIATLFQGLVLIIFNSSACQKGFYTLYLEDSPFPPGAIESVSCSLARGSNMIIAATVLYFMSMITAPAATPPSPVSYPNGLRGPNPQAAAEPSGGTGGGGDAGAGSDPPAAATAPDTDAEKGGAADID